MNISQNCLGGLNALNTHFYDGHISYIIDFFKEELKRIHDIPKNEKMIIFQKLKDILFLNNSITPNAVLCFNTLLVESNSNYDNINKVDAQDLLYLIYEYIMKEIGENPVNKETINKSEYTNLLITQLEDMISGLCSQGRITRLFQVLLLKMNIEEN